LILDECDLKDSSFAKILEGVSNQCTAIKQVEKCHKLQYLQRLTYSNNSLGQESLNQLKKLLPKIMEVSMNNVKFSGLNNDEENGGGLCEDDEDHEHSQW